MSAEKIRVTPEELGSAASRAESIISEYTTCYQRIKAAAEELSVEWNGPASMGFKARVDSFENDFKSLNNLLITYVDFLRAAKANYEENENEILRRMETLTKGN